MHSKNNNKAIKINDKPEEVIEVFEWLLNRYLKDLET